MHIPQTLLELQPGDHLCCIYETEDQHRAVLAPFLRQGLLQGEKVLYIVDEHTTEVILDYLRDGGLDVESFIDRGQLNILTSNDTYLKNGLFDPDAMIALLKSEMEQALAEGYSALRFTGEMTWALRGLPGTERLIEYETRLNHFLPGSFCLVICQYDRRRFGADVLLDLLRTHPVAIIGMNIYENFYYVPPEKLADRSPIEMELQRWITSLAERKRAEQALRESETQYRLHFESVSDIIYSLDPEYKIIDISPSVERLLGFKPEELIGKPFYELQLLSPESLEQAASDAFRVLEGEQIDSTVYQFIAKDGTKRWGEVSGTPLVRNGEIVAIVSVARDITEREQAREALLHSKALLETAGKIARFGGWSADLIENRVIWSDQVAAIHEVPPGFSPCVEEGISFYAPEWQEKITQVFNDCARDGLPYDEEMEIITARGNRLWVRATGEAVRDRAGIIVRVQGAFQDITPRKRAEEQAREKSKEQAWLLKSMMNAFVLFDSIFDADGNFISYRFRYINDAYERITGVKQEEVFAKSVHQVWPETEASWIENYGSVAMTGKSMTFDMYHKPTAKYYHCYVYRPWDTNDRFCVVFDDITEQKQAEAQLNEQLDELRRWQAVTLGREGRVMELKREVNELLAQAGKAPRYPSVLDFKYLGE